MNYKKIIISALLAASIEHAWGMEDDLQQRANKLRDRIQSSIQELQKEYQAKVDAVSKCEALMRPNIQIINIEPEFAEVRIKMLELEKELKESEKYKIGIGTVAANTATSLTKDFEIAMQQYQTRVGNNNDRQ
jgi:hypothetical protein